MTAVLTPGIPTVDFSSLEIIQLAVWPYHLGPKNPWMGSQGCEGMLLRVQFRGREVFEGFSDYRPWPTFGDWDEQTLRNELLSKRILDLSRIPPVLFRSIEYAVIDGFARCTSGSLWTTVRALGNSVSDTFEPYITVVDPRQVSQEDWHAIARRARSAKVKLKIDGPEGSSWADACGSTGLSVVLDPNQGMSPLEVGDSILKLRRMGVHVLGVEDPFATNINENQFEEWIAFARALDVRVFVDQPLRDVAGVDLFIRTMQQPDSRHLTSLRQSLGVVLKPAVMSASTIQLLLATRVPVRWSSYLDHPVGQAFGFWRALQFSQVNGSRLTHEVPSFEAPAPCGFGSYMDYVSTPFDWSFDQLPSGSGIGWDKEFASLPWSTIWERP